MKPGLQSFLFNNMLLNSFYFISILPLAEEGVQVVGENTNNGSRGLNPLASTQEFNRQQSAYRRSLAGTPTTAT